MDLVSGANQRLLDNGIDVKELALQAGSAVADASIVLAAKMFDDGKIVVANAVEDALKSPEGQKLSLQAK